MLLTTLALRARAIEWLQPARYLGDRLKELAVPTLWSLVIVVITYFVAGLLSGHLRRRLGVTGFQVNVAILLSRALWIVIWALGIALVFGQFGPGFASLTAFIGVVGLAASLSLQSVLQNLVAGVYLLAERPFAIGDTIAVVGPNGVNHEGTVEDIEMRTTHLRSRDNELILVPNAAIFNGVVTNRTAVGGFATHAIVTFPRETDPDTIRHEAVPLLAALPSVLSEPTPVLHVDRVSAETWTGSLVFWSDSSQAVSEVIWALGKGFPLATVNDVAVLA